MDCTGVFPYRNAVVFNNSITATIFFSKEEMYNIY